MEERMELTFTGRGMQITDEIRDTATHKVAALARIEPRTTRMDLEFIAAHHPKPGMARVEAALATPRKTFRAHGDGRDVPSALDEVVGHFGSGAPTCLWVADHLAQPFALLWNRMVHSPSRFVFDLS